MNHTAAIEPLSDETAPARSDAAQRLGPKPTMTWLPKKSLKVDRKYQRALTSTASLKLIEQLKENFCWTHCGMLVVTGNADGTYSIIDGQHRWRAAMDIGEISTLPCFLHDEMTLKEQAGAFVALNASRVPVNKLAIFHARACAGEPLAMDLLCAARAAGVSIMRSHQSLKDLAPNQTVALGILTRIHQAYDDRPFAVETVTATLKAVREAYPDKVGQLTSGMIGAVWELLAEDMDRDALISALKRTDDAALQLSAREAVFANRDLKIRDGYRAALKALIAGEGTA